MVRYQGSKLTLKIYYIFYNGRWKPHIKYTILLICVNVYIWQLYAEWVRSWRQMSWKCLYYFCYSFYHTQIINYPQKGNNSRYKNVFWWSLHFRLQLHWSMHIFHNVSHYLAKWDRTSAQMTYHAPSRQWYPFLGVTEGSCPKFVTKFVQTRNWDHGASTEECRVCCLLSIICLPATAFISKTDFDQ